MVLCLKVLLADAEKCKSFLLKKNIVDFSFNVLKEDDFIFFALTNNPSGELLNDFKKICSNFELCEKDLLEKKVVPRTLKQALKNVLSEKEQSELVSSFDIIGHIALIEIPKSLEKKEILIADALLKVNKNIKTVLKISGEHQGRFRLQPVSYVLGKRQLATTHKEHGCVFKVELGKVFFSPRLSQERKRISSLIKAGENIAVLFAGVGPFAIVFAKNSYSNKIFAVELNKVAVDLMVENIALNRVEEKVEPILGDVKEIVPKFLLQKCDRVVMPLPKGGESFLIEAFQCLKPKGGIIHFYQFESRNNPFEPAEKKVFEIAQMFEKKAKILRKSIVRSFSPSKVQIVLDVKVE